MKIHFSRHARRRAKLYKIPEQIVTSILENRSFLEGQHELIEEVEEFRYPIKIVIAAGNETITVITCYPLKKKREQQ